MEKINSKDAFKALGSNVVDAAKEAGKALTKKETWKKIGSYFKGIGLAFAAKN